MTEAQIQRACLDLLEALRLQGLPVYATRTNSGKIRTTEGYSVRLCREGWPDLSAIIAGKFVGIECKRSKGGAQSPEQIKAQRAIEQAGGVYLLVDSIAVLRKYLKTCAMMP